ncbi:MAG: hypothetical protein J0H68_02595 [Sphingobacteriia bacterium]|nr:hypothetical protein [Sphingobacteriia bacterium]
MSEERVSIVGLPKALVLQALCNNVKPKFPGMSKISMRYEEAEAIIRVSEKTNNFIYGVIKNIFHLDIDLHGFDFDPTNYDRMYGKGLAKKIINTLYKQIEVEE